MQEDFAVDQSLSRRAIGLAGAGAGISALAAAAPAWAKKKKKTVVPPMIHAGVPLLVLEDATPDGAGRSGVRYRLVIGDGLHAVETTSDQQVLPASAESLLRGAGGRGQIFQITGTIAPLPQGGEDRGFAYTGRFAGTFSVLSGAQDPETGVRWSRRCCTAAPSGSPTRRPSPTTVARSSSTARWPP